MPSLRDAPVQGGGPGRPGKRSVPRLRRFARAGRRAREVADLRSIRARASAADGGAAGTHQRIADRFGDFIARREAFLAQSQLDARRWVAARRSERRPPLRVEQAAQDAHAARPRTSVRGYRRWSPRSFPILAVEAVLAALTSFTLVGPLGLPWWLPLICLAMIGAASAGLRQLALSKGRELWRGLAIVRTLRSGSLLIGFVLVAVFAQIFRNWLLLHAVGVDASFFGAIAVLIAVVTLAQLPVGPSVGAAAAVLILGSDGVAAAAVAGVLLTVTGTVGGLTFAAWAGADKLWSLSRRAALPHARPRVPRSHRKPDCMPD
jgi:hypothetical protein